MSPHRTSKPPHLPRGLRARLLRWYARVARDLPWRRTRDPYAIWVSEIMLQQTRVDTVIPYYERFLERFPTLRALAEADEDDVLGLWSGLGYYRRARLLHAGVKAVLREHGGAVPKDAAARRALPGVGRYTAGAIGSIGLGLEEPLVDGNVARVLARLFAVRSPLGSRRADEALWALASALVVGPRPGDLNQALMELGATLCTPRTPRCAACPAARSCAAHLAGLEGILPRMRARARPRLESRTAVVALAEGAAPRVWLVRSTRARYGGLWEVPSSLGEGTPSAALREAGLVTRRALRPVGAVRHALTHRRLEIAVYRVDAARARVGSAACAVPFEALGSLGVSTLTRRLLTAAGLDLHAAGEARPTERRTAGRRVARRARRGIREPLSRGLQRRRKE